MTVLERAWRGGKNDWRLHALSIFSVSVAFVCLAASLLVVVNVDGVRDRWARAGRATVFLTGDSSPRAVATLDRALRSVPGVADVKHVTAEASRKEIIGERNDELLAQLPVEAFPASLEVTFDESIDTAALARIRAQLETLPSVESVETYEVWTERLAALLGAGVSASVLLAFVVLGAVVSVVASTLRMALQRRGREVEVLKLVGATDAYVRRPFVIEGAAQGALGALLAVVILAGLYAVVTSRFDGELATLLGINPTFLPVSIALGLVVLGAALGAVAAMATLRKLLVV